MYVITGFIGVWDMSASVWYVSLYIVRKELRQHGIGSKLWSAMLNRTRGSKCIGLDGVLAMKDWYTKQGFVYEPFQGDCYVGSLDTVDMTTDLGSAVCTVTPLSQEMWPALLDYDRDVYPYCRERVLRAWFRGQESHTVVALSEGNVTGYGNFHTENNTEHHIRALCGDNKAIAETILYSMFENVPNGSTLQFRLLSDKTVPTVFSGFKSRSTCYRMFTNACPGIKTNRIYINAAEML